MNIGTKNFNERQSTESLLAIDSNSGAYRETPLYQKIAQPEAEILLQENKKGKQNETAGLKHFESLMKQYNRLLKPMKMVDLLKPRQVSPK